MPKHLIYFSPFRYMPTPCSHMQNSYTRMSNPFTCMLKSIWINEFSWYAIPSHRLRRLLSPGRAGGSAKSYEKIHTLARTMVIVSSFTKCTTFVLPGENSWRSQHEGTKLQMNFSLYATPKQHKPCTPNDCPSYADNPPAYANTDVDQPHAHCA